MDFLNKYLQSTTSLLCDCQREHMNTLEVYSKQKMITFEDINRLLKSIPSDLIIVTEDKEAIHTHKLLVGLVSEILANILLEEDFFGEIVTLFIPESSNTIKAALANPGNDGKNILDLLSCVLPHTANLKLDTLAIKEEQKEEEDASGPDVKEITYNTIEHHEHETDSSRDFNVRLIKKKGSCKKKRDKIDAQKKSEKDVCAICSLSISVEKIVPHLIVCRQKHEDPKKKKVNCPICNKNLNFKNFIGMHYYKCSNWTIPGSEKKRLIFEAQESRRTAILDEPISCSECGKMFYTDLKLRCHMKVHQKDKTYHCDKCEFKTHRKDYLDNHIKNRHTAAKYVTCEICGTRLKDNRVVVQLHMKHQHTKQEMVKCGECGKEFTKVALSKHLRRVHGEQKHACHLCSYKTQSSYNLKLHISKSHLGLKGIPKEKCQYCEVEATNLPHHMKVHHPEI